MSTSKSTANAEQQIFNSNTHHAMQKWTRWNNYWIWHGKSDTRWKSRVRKCQLCSAVANQHLKVNQERPPTRLSTRIPTMQCRGKREETPSHAGTFMQPIKLVVRRSTLTFRGISLTSSQACNFELQWGCEWTTWGTELDKVTTRCKNCWCSLT